MDNLFQLAYTSTASELFDKADLRNMLTEFNQRNLKTGITGILLYKDGHFMQILEGLGEVVTTMFGRISRDQRHHGILPLFQGTVQERQFPQWSMAFRDLNQPEDQGITAFSKFLNTPLTGEEFGGNTDRCEKLLLEFKRNIR